MLLMLAVDGSEASLRATDHVSFMLTGNNGIKLTLFHVPPRQQDACEIDFTQTQGDVDEIVARGAKRCVDNFYAHAQKVFSAAGFKKKQIELKTVTGRKDVGKAILSEAKKGDYGTVIIGRRGADKSFFMGSVSKQVLYKMSGRAVWVVS